MLTDKSNTTRERDFMKQIISNYLSVFVPPIIIALIVRILLRRFDKAYLATVAFALLTVVAWIAAQVIPSHGSELYGLMAVEATTAFVTSLLTGLVLRLKSRKENKELE